MGKVKKSHNTKKTANKLIKETPKQKRIKGRINKTKREFFGNVIKINGQLNKNTFVKNKQLTQDKKNGIRQEIKRPPVDKDALKKHRRGDGLESVTSIKTGFQKQLLQRKEEKIEWTAEQTARAEILLTENTGYVEPDAGETTTQFTQKQLASSVDISAAAKHFDLQLKFGPYRMKYTRNGRHMLLGGKLGHVAAFDWQTKKLHCEINVMESVYDVQWLHNNTMFAVAQKKWVYIYDNVGVEIHCLKKIHGVLQMEFLPYHFLLATGSERGYLTWLDISIGQIVSQFNSKLGRISTMTQNPSNAVLHVGQQKGVVSLWKPTLKDPLASILCHHSPITGIAINSTGRYMATSAVDNRFKIWDLRQLKDPIQKSGPLQQYGIRCSASNLAFSQKNLLAVSMGNVVEVYRDCCTETADRAYLRHRTNSTIGNMMFCPYEDVLGVATNNGFVSLLVPGAGEANFDALEVNPYQTKSQRQESEVKALLDKIPAELISLDPNAIAEVDVPSLKERIEAKKNLIHLKPPKIDYQPRNKAKGRGGSAKIARNKKIVQEQTKREFVRVMKNVNVLKENENEKNPQEAKSVLDRFKIKQK